MVDVTFIFLIVFGGALVGLVTARVRGHAARRKSLDVIAGWLGGFIGTPLWTIAVTTVKSAIGTPASEMSPAMAGLLSDAYYLSPILGGFLGVGVLSLIYRAVVGGTGQDPLLVKVGHLIQIFGTVYLVVAVCLTLALVALAALNSLWDVLSPRALLVDLGLGAAIMLAGRTIARYARPTGA